MSRKIDLRKPSLWTEKQAEGWGPHILAKLKAGEIVDCAGFLLKLGPDALNQNAPMKDETEQMSLWGSDE